MSGTLSGPGGGSASFIFNGGDFSGSGTINGQRFDNEGKLLPGVSPGVMTINADYTQFAEGTLEIEIGGALSEVEHDQLIVNGNATLGGTLVLKFIDDFSPRTGQTFDFLTVDGNLAGAFDNLEVVDLAPAFEFEVTPTGGGMMMTAMNDGVFTGIVGEINDVTIGFNSPEAETTAAPGDTNVPMLQFEVVPEADGLSISELTFRASGSGDDVADVTSVTVWVDENGDGQVDLELLADVLAAGEVEEEGNDLFDETDDMLFAEGDRRIGSGTFGADDGTLILTIDPPLEVGARETVMLLVTYDLAGDSPSADESGASRGSRKNAGRTQGTSIQPVLALLLLPSILLLGVVGTRQGRVSLRARVSIGMTAVLLAAAVVCFPGCGGGDSVVDPGPNPNNKTLQVTLIGIGAQESDSDADASVEGLSIHGTILTVSR